MPQTENGLAGNVIANMPGAVAIASSGAFAGPPANQTQLVTGAVHNLTTGDYVNIQNHQTNTGANGIWPVTVISTTAFYINTVSGAAGAATGTVQKLTRETTAQLPQDGTDLEDATSVNVPFEWEADGIAYNMLTTGAYKLAAIQTIALTSDTPGATPFVAASVSANTWTPFTEVGGPFAGYPLVSNAVAGDIIEYTAFGVAQTQTTAGLTQVKIGLGFTLGQPGAAPGAFTKLVGMQLQANSTTLLQPFALSACIFAATQIITTQFAFLYSGAVSTILSIFSDCGVVAKVWRPTGKPQ